MTDRILIFGGPEGRHIAVPFAGEGGGTGPLSWGQRELWEGMRRQNTWLPLGFVKPLPAGTTVEQVVADLRFLMCHYPPLRTRLRLDPDGPTQVVADAGEVALELVDVAADDDPAPVAQQVEQHYWDTDYDFEREWPLRMAVVRHRGEPTHLVLVMCHLVTDAFGATVMLDELAAHAATGSAAAPAPLAQARWQCSPAGQRHCRTVLRRWERLLWTVPARRFPESVSPPAPRYWHASFTSRAAYLAVRTLAARAGVDDSSVLLAAFVAAQAQLTGLDPVALQVVVSNRFRPGLADTVSPINQTGLLVVDAVGRGFEEVLGQVRRRAMAAYKYAYYDPEQMDALVARVARERGEDVDLGCYFNDRRLQRPTVADGPAPTPAEVRAALPETAFRWEYGQDDKPYEPLFVHIEDSSGTVALSVFADTHYVAPADLEACVRGVEEVTVAAAIDQSPGAELPVVPQRLEADPRLRHRPARVGSGSRSDAAPAAGW